MHPESQSRTRRSLPHLSPVIGILPAALGLLFMLIGCGSGDSSATQSLVRSINAYIPAVGADGSLTLLGNGTFLTGGNLGFGQVANGGSYVTLNSGPFSANASGPTVTTPIQLTGQTLNGNNTAYTLVAVGQAGQTGTLVPQLLLIPNYTTNVLTIASGDAAIRVIDVSLSPNPIGLYATSNSTPSAALATGLGNIAYGYSSTTNAYVNVPTTQLTNMALVDVTTPQTALSLSSAGNLNTFTFTAGQAYTLYVFGQPGSSADPLTALWVVDYPAP